MNARTQRTAFTTLLTVTTLFVASGLRAQDEDWRHRRDQPRGEQRQEGEGKRVVPVPERVGPGPGRVIVPGGGVDVRVWTDRGEQATYCPGEPIEIYFATNTDAYVTIYDIDTRGQVQVLFPAPYDNDNLVRGGRTYRVSPGWGTRLAVSGPQGREAIRAVAVAAYDRYEPHGRGYDNDGYDDYDGRYREDDRWNESWKGRQGVDPDDFDRELGKRVVPVPQGDRDVDQTGFYVASGYRCGGGYGGGRRDGYGGGHFGWEVRGGWHN